jgi:hypothetical protein
VAGRLESLGRLVVQMAEKLAPDAWRHSGRDLRNIA